MSVQIPDGRKGTIHVFPDDDPRELAEKFCKKYGLTESKMMKLVERHITENVLALNPRSEPTNAAMPPRVSKGADTARLPMPPSTPPPLADYALAKPPPPPHALLPEEQFDPAPYASTMVAQTLPPPPRYSEASLNGGNSPLGMQCAESSRHRLAPATVVRWRSMWERQHQLALCWRALVLHVAWQQRERGYANRFAAMELEVQELHAANSRIAVLAFGQSGLAEEEAHKKLLEIFAPSEAARQAVRELSVVQREYENLLQSRCRSATRRRRNEKLGECWMEWQGGYATKQEEESERAALEMRKAVGEAQRLCDELAREKLEHEATKQQLEAVQADLALRSSELDEMTSMLINSKLHQAEMNGEVLGTLHDLRSAEKAERTEALSVDEKKLKKVIMRRESFPRANTCSMSSIPVDLEL
mmetsp:Transcript_33307/g.55055  ORF Transcript_33307/g.55055 Transcript_33307/m.55055 type:complete len:418 (-) Transcript_33307:404-1657(-)